MKFIDFGGGVSAAALEFVSHAAPEPGVQATFKAVGDCGLLVEFGSHIDDETSARVLQLDAALASEKLPNVIEAIVAYTSLLIVFDARITDYDKLKATVSRLASLPVTGSRKSRRWRIPVAYGGAFGLDLDEAASRLGMSREILVAAHADAEYTVAMFGFLPGFAYLSGLPPHLALPRRMSPRARIFSGSIAIGGSQTAIGSIEGPSGWNVIGRTPLRTFDADRCPATFFEPGDLIHLEAITNEQFHELAARSATGEIVAMRVA